MNSVCVTQLPTIFFPTEHPGISGCGYAGVTEGGALTIAEEDGRTARVSSRGD